jgi:hypothetical protein
MCHIEFDENFINGLRPTWNVNFVTYVKDILF